MGKLSGFSTASGSRWHWITVGGSVSDGIVGLVMMGMDGLGVFPVVESGDITQPVTTRHSSTSRHIILHIFFITVPPYDLWEI
jgi:hypothetical protein